MRICSIRGAKAVQRGQASGRRDFEDRSVVIRTACHDGAIKVAIGAQGEPTIGRRTVGSGESMERCDRAGRRDLENCAQARGTSTLDGSVEVSVSALRHDLRVVRLAGLNQAIEIMQVGVGLSLERRRRHAQGKPQHTQWQHAREVRQESSPETQQACCCGAAWCVLMDPLVSG